MDGYRHSRATELKFTQEQYLDLQRRVDFMIGFLSDRTNYSYMKGAVPDLDKIIDGYRATKNLLSQAKGAFVFIPNNNQQAATKADICYELGKVLWNAVDLSGMQLMNGIKAAGGSDEYCALANNMTRNIGIHLNSAINDMNFIEYRLNRGKFLDQNDIIVPQELQGEQAHVNAFFARQNNPAPAPQQPAQQQPAAQQPAVKLPSVTAKEQLNSKATEFVSNVSSSSMGDAYSAMLAKFIKLERIVRSDRVIYPRVSKELQSVISVMQKNMPLFSAPAKNDGEVFQRLQVLQSITGFAHHLVKNKSNDFTLLSAADSTAATAELQYLTKSLAEDMNKAINEQNSISGTVGKKYSGAPKLVTNIPKPEFRAPHIVTAVLLKSLSENATFNDETIRALNRQKIDASNLLLDANKETLQFLSEQQKFFDRLEKYNNKVLQGNKSISKEDKLAELKSLQEASSKLVEMIDKNYEALADREYTVERFSGLRFAVNEINNRIINKEIKQLGGKGIDDAQINSARTILGVDLKDVPELSENPVFFSFRTAGANKMSQALADIEKIVKGFECFDANKTEAAAELKNNAKALREFITLNRNLFSQPWDSPQKEDAKEHYEVVSRVITGFNQIYQDGKDFLASYYVTKEDEQVENAINSVFGEFKKLQSDAAALREKHEFPQNFKSETASLSNLKRKTPPAHDYAADDEALSSKNSKQAQLIKDLKNRNWSYTDSVHREFQKSIEDGVKQVLDYVSKETDAKERNRFNQIASSLIGIYERIETNPVSKLSKISSQIELRNAAVMLDRMPQNRDLNMDYYPISRVEDATKKENILRIMEKINYYGNILNKDRQAMQPLSNTAPDMEITPFTILQAVKDGRKIGRDADIPLQEPSSRSGNLSEKQQEFLSTHALRTTPDVCEDLSRKFANLSKQLMDKMEECSNATERAGFMKAAQILLKTSNTLHSRKDLFNANPKNEADLENIRNAQRSLIIAKGDVRECLRVVTEAFYGSASLVHADFYGNLEKVSNVLNDSLADVENIHKLDTGRDRPEKFSFDAVLKDVQARERKSRVQAQKENASKERPAYQGTAFDFPSDIKMSPQELKERDEFFKFKEANMSQEKWLKEKAEAAEKERLEQIRREKEEKEKAQRELEEKQRKALEEEQKLKAEQERLREEKLNELKPETEFAPENLKRVLANVKNLRRCYDWVPASGDNGAEIAKERKYLASLKNDLAKEIEYYEKNPEKWDADGAKQLEILQKVANINKFIEDSARKNLDDVLDYDPETKIINHGKAFYNDSMQRLRKYANLAAKSYPYKQVLYNLGNGEKLPEYPGIPKILNQDEEIRILKEELQGFRAETFHPDFVPKNIEQEAPAREKEEDSKEIQNEAPKEVEESVNEAPEKVNNEEQKEIQNEPSKVVEEVNEIDTKVSEKKASKKVNGPVDFTSLNEEQTNMVAKEYLDEFKRLQKELAKTDSRLSKDTKPYQDLRKDLGDIVKLMDSDFLNCDATQKNAFMKKCFEKINKDIGEYRKAKQGLDKLSSRQIKRLKVMNRISLLNREYKNGIAKPNTSYKVKLAEKLVNNYLVSQASKNKAAADMLVNETSFLSQTTDLGQSDAFKEYIKSGMNVEDTVKKDGASVLKEFKAWVKEKGIQMPDALLSKSSPKVENQMQMDGMH